MTKIISLAVPDSRCTDEWWADLDEEALAALLEGLGALKRADRGSDERVRELQQQLGELLKTQNDPSYLMLSMLLSQLQQVMADVGGMKNGKNRYCCKTISNAKRRCRQAAKTIGCQRSWK